MKTENLTTFLETTLDELPKNTEVLQINVHDNCLIGRNKITKQALFIYFDDRFNSSFETNLLSECNNYYKLIFDLMLNNYKLGYSETETDYFNIILDKQY